MKKLNKYSSKLFATYLIIVLFAVFILTLYFEKTMTQIYQNKSEENIQQSTENIKKNIAAYFLDMDRIAIQLLTNKEIVDFLYAGSKPLSKQEELIITNEIENRLLNIISPLFEIRKATLLNSNKFYSVGLAETNYKMVEKMKARILEEVLQGDTKQRPIISNVHSDFWSSNEGKVISLFRIVQTNKVKSLIEVQRSYDEFISNIVTEGINDNRFIYVLNEDSEILYSSIQPKNFGEDENVIVNYLKNFKENQISSGEIKEYYYNLETVNNYGIKFVVAQPKADLMQYYYKQKQYLAIIVILLVVFLFLASWYLSLKMTKPLNNIKKKMKLLTIENINGIYAPEDSDLDEMNQVYCVFKDMSLRLSESIDLLIESRKLEFRAQHAALQSQIAPHFIGNTLTIIGAKGYENGMPIIDEMCVLLSSMMSYITKQNDFETTIGKEIDYTRNYLELIKYRYEDKFDYELHIEEELSNIPVPMLIIQPIVENSILHGFTPEMKCLKISVMVERDGSDRWKIIIRDNGKGFTQESLEKFDYLVESYKINQNIFQGSDLSVGLFNAYVRVNMVYGDNTLWEIFSDSEETSIVIGGTYV